MGTGTDVETVKSSKKKHVCSWCAEPIEIGESYKKWRWFSDGDATTIKMHLECEVAVNGMEREDIQDGWTPGEFARGCGCLAGECDTNLENQRMKP